MADLYQIKLLYSTCSQLIRRHLKMVKKEANWLELKKNAPELAFAILEEFAEEIENRNYMQNGTGGRPIVPNPQQTKMTVFYL
jgi:hypothetical protein